MDEVIGYELKPGGYGYQNIYKKDSDTIRRQMSARYLKEKWEIYQENFNKKFGICPKCHCQIPLSGHCDCED